VDNFLFPFLPFSAKFIHFCAYLQFCQYPVLNPGCKLSDNLSGIVSKHRNFYLYAKQPPCTRGGCRTFHRCIKLLPDHLLNQAAGRDYGVLPDTSMQQSRCHPAAAGNGLRFSSRSPAWSLSDRCQNGSGP